MLKYGWVKGKKQLVPDGNMESMNDTFFLKHDFLNSSHYLNNSIIDLY